ncbi:TIGR02611 family protein [Tenggerimyces flavus]|uniref:TIGR02611 family protein n=1 Tax=Tenggerimyces flavus TaxID=1708749 RepID=A0ABV7YDY2_9ACTN|nr:TIGR02611 family protein [Tenggerimyces flavus]MBM7787844.1 uncharacterized protein (TIGR02611 family) [Tenggerimyces flavus]
MHEDDSSSGPTAPPAPPDPSRPKLHVRVRGRIRNNKPLDLTWRIGVFVVGALFVVAGLIMFVTPGPGWLALLLGLAILATEFSWAERLLHWAREKAKLAAEKALDPRVRRRNILIAVAVIVAAGLLVWAYVAAFGWPTPVLSIADWVRSLAK